MFQETSTPERDSVQIGEVEIRYYVREPSPDQWNAVGVIYNTRTRQTCEKRCPLVVGLGSTYYEAVGDLIARVLRGEHPDLPKDVIRFEVFNVSYPAVTA